MVRTVRPWVDAFNSGGFDKVLESGGQLAIDGEFGVTRGVNTSKAIKLPVGHDKESLRRAAADASNPKLKERLLALATLYETKSMAVAARKHQVSVTQLTSWRDLLSEGGVDAVSFKGKENYRPTPEEIEAAVQNATSEVDRSLLRAAGAVFSGARTQDAAAEWKVQPLTLAAFVAKVTKGDASALVLEPASIKVRWSARQLRAMAKRAKPKMVLVLEALARISEGTPLREVVNETITVDLLKRTEARLWEGDQPPLSKANEPNGDETLLEHLEKWPSPRREPFLMTIRWLMIHRLSQREGFEQALASNGIPKDAFEMWFDRARRKGFSSLAALAAAGTPPSLVGLPKVPQVEEPRFPRNIHRQILGMIAYSNGASIKSGATIANILPGEFFRLVSAYNEDGLDAFERIRLGQRHATVTGLKEWRKRQNEPFPQKVADLLIASFSDDPNFSDLLTSNNLEATAVEKWHQLVKAGEVSALDTLVLPLADVPASHTAADIRAMVPYLRTDLVRRKASALIALYEGASPAGAADASSLEEADVLAVLADLNKHDLATVLGFAKVRTTVSRKTATPPASAAVDDASREAEAKQQMKDRRAAEKAATRAKNARDLQAARLKVRKSEQRIAAEAEQERLKQEATQNEKKQQQAAAAIGRQERKAAAENGKKERLADSAKKKLERIAIAERGAAGKARLKEQKRGTAKSTEELAALSKASPQRPKPSAGNHAKIAKRHSELEIAAKQATKVKPIANEARPAPLQAKRLSHAPIQLREDYNVARIDEMLRSASSSTVVKLKMLRKAYEGDDPDDIAATLHLHPALLTHWINVFNSDGLIGLMLASKRLPN